MEEIAEDDPGSVAELESYRAAGRAWVAVDAADRPVAYLVSSVVDGCAHVDQVSVDPAHAGHGIGAELIDHLAETARAEGHAALTLTTFADVPWNAPYYRRLGFEPIDPSEWGPELRALTERERTAIPGNAPRIAMRKQL